ncbi:MAG: hypothetical protein J7K98_01860 [Candidatus Aenigmarchaeota archaeon]|nr:hypothetical protein [Candidatus Aenigmarchaeota archaeon]
MRCEFCGSHAVIQFSHRLVKTRICLSCKTIVHYHPLYTEIFKKVQIVK